MEAAQQTIGSQIKHYQPIVTIKKTWNLTLGIRTLPGGEVLPFTRSCGANHRNRSLLLLLGACSSVGTSHLRVRGKDRRTNSGVDVIDVTWIPMYVLLVVFAMCVKILFICNCLLHSINTYTFSINLYFLINSMSNLL